MSRELTKVDCDRCPLEKVCTAKKDERVFSTHALAEDCPLVKVILGKKEESGRQESPGESPIPD